MAAVEQLPDWVVSSERSFDRIREHYDIERELADRLRAASGPERLQLYSVVYDELFRRVPDHPQLVRKANANSQRERNSSKIRFLERFVDPDSVFVEVGAGDCSLSLELAAIAKRVYAVDVSEQIARTEEAPANFELVISDGVSIPVPAGSATLVYSNQLMEHLHPDDANEQLKNIFRALAPGGRYVCVTPNRVTGPHDISKYFDTTARGFHLKEYTVGELKSLFKHTGFSNIQTFVSIRGTCRRMPLASMAFCETLIGLLPQRVRLRSNSPTLAKILDTIMVGQKPAEISRS